MERNQEINLIMKPAKAWEEIFAEEPKIKEIPRKIYQFVENLENISKNFEAQH
jgi:hypothetical protein